MAAIARSDLEECVAGSWYDLAGEQLRALAARFGIGAAWAQMHRAYDLICKESLGLCPADSASRKSSLNGVGAPIQFALTLGEQAPPLQFLSEADDPKLDPLDAWESMACKVRNLSALLRQKGDIDSLIRLLERISAANAYELAPDGGGTFWMGAGLTREGDCGLKVYVNGKQGTETEQWRRMGEFAAYFGAAELHEELWKMLGGRMAPLGMGVALSQSRNPAGRLYFNGYGNCVSYYEDLLRHFGSAQHVKAFRQYTEVMLAAERSYPTQSVVFSAGFESGRNAAPDIKVEFCGHCLFQSDWQARERCLHWLALRQIESRPYGDMLRILAGQMSVAKVDAHVYVGLGWKGQQEYSTIYLKPLCPSRRRTR